MAVSSSYSVVVPSGDTTVDLKAVPLVNPDLILYMDGMSSRVLDGSLLSGYAICMESEILESGKLPVNYSAQAELFSLT